MSSINNEEMPLFFYVWWFNFQVVVIAEPINEVGKIQVQKLKDEFGEMRIYLLQVDILNPKELESMH